MYSRYTNTNAGGFRCSDTNHLLTSDFSSSTWGERQFLKVFRIILCKPPPPIFWHILWCFRSQFIFSGRDLQNLTAAAMVENSTLWQRTLFSAPMAEAQLSACMVQSQILNCLVKLQLLNTMVRPQLNLFQNIPNSQPISSGHDVIHIPATFPVRGLLWQWWLSYLSCTSVNCTQCYAPKLLTRIVHSPTKLNDKI